MLVCKAFAAARAFAVNACAQRALPFSVRASLLPRAATGGRGGPTNSWIAPQGRES